MAVKTKYKLVVQSPDQMRYVTTGDYYKVKGTWVVAVPVSGNDDYDFLGFIHELIELYLTQRRGIPEPKIKKFDEWFERESAGGHFRQYPSPGHHPKAPYRREHLFASKVERIVAKELGVDFKKYWEADDIVFEKVKKALRRKSKKR